MTNVKKVMDWIRISLSEEQLKGVESFVEESSEIKPSDKLYLLGAIHLRAYQLEAEMEALKPAVRIYNPELPTVESCASPADETLKQTGS